MRLPTFAQPDYDDDDFVRLLFQLAESLHDEVIKQQDHWDVLAYLEDACFSAREEIWADFTPLNIYVGPTVWPKRSVLPGEDNLIHIRLL